MKPTRASIRPPESLSTERLELKRANADIWDDVESLYSNVRDSDQVFQYCSWSQHSTKSDTASYISERTREWEDNVRYEYVVYNSDGDAVGATYIATKRMFNQPELGLWLTKPSWGNRYAEEIADRLLDIGFNTLGRDCIRAGCRIGNTKSRRALGRIFDANGGLFEGTLQKPDYLWNSFSLSREQYEDPSKDSLRTQIPESLKQ